ncbi:MAG: hypothetical protein A2138_11360 [Deltaproteobacteria bacterium RBG_16_71_12]|nr:MAG: hypothetical protein A2138_11360 [Deltaproteobacteria bacterium RBG_16_71_12]
MKAAGTVSPRCRRVPALLTMPSAHTSSGKQAAVMSAVAPPIEWPTTAKRKNPSARMQLCTKAARFSALGDGKALTGVSPKPGMSKRTAHRPAAASAGPA